MARIRPDGPGVAIQLVRNGREIGLAPKHQRVEGTPLPPLFERSIDVDSNEYVGFWYELMKGSEVLYRASGIDPTGASREFPGAGTLSRTKRKGVVQEFELLVPLADAINATTLRIFSQDLALCEGLVPSRPVATLDISIKESELE